MLFKKMFSILLISLLCCSCLSSVSAIKPHQKDYRTPIPNQVSFCLHAYALYDTQILFKDGNGALMPYSLSYGYTCTGSTTYEIEADLSTALKAGAKTMQVGTDIDGNGHGMRIIYEGPVTGVAVSFRWSCTFPELWETYLNPDNSVGYRHIQFNDHYHQCQYQLA
ncbi:hypothetical protein AGMMS49960_22400 [Betaproteobacteria bacterium]|nr:hypothetical protein AGMMS49960_22400 [Betaproteobacteria bacterium]